MLHFFTFNSASTKSGLTILEAMVLLVTSLTLSVIIVPVFLVKYDLVKVNQFPLISNPPENLPEIKLTPVSKPALPAPPKLPSGDAPKPVAPLN